jgi:hypothetical protein
MRPQDVARQVRDLTVALVGVGLCNDQNFPSTYGDPAHSFEISIGSESALAIALRNLPYAHVYDEMNRARAFNFKMLDGALITMRYRFNRGEVVEHALTYFPSASLEHFQNEPEIYEEDEIYADVVARSIVAFPVRFDFNASEERYVDVHHPRSHLTLGQYSNCRIPVWAPVTPSAFMQFLLRSFYNTAYRKYSDELTASEATFAKTISEKECRVSHIVCLG